MNKSKWWNQMYIIKPNEKSEIGIISKDKPVEANIPSSVKFDIPSDFNQLSEFYKKYNKTEFGNITLAPKSLLQSFTNLNSIYVILKYIKDESIIGSILTIPLTIKINKETISVGCTSFLCVKKELHHIGLGINLIRKLIEKGYQQKIICGYHLVPTPHTGNSLLLKTWYRPMTNVQRFGITVPKGRSKIHERLRYKIPKMSNGKLIQVNLNNLKLTHKEFIKYNSKIIWKPNIYQWEKWSREFKIYGVLNSKDEYVGWFIIRPEKVLFQTIGNIGSVCLMIGEQPLTLKGVLHAGKEYD